MPTNPAWLALAWSGNEPSVRVSAAGDPVEQRADAIAARMLGSTSASLASASGSKPERARGISPATLRSFQRSGSGRPLEPELHARFSANLGEALPEVRVHVGGDADTITRGFATSALTLGSHLFLGSRAPSPRSSAGEALLAHELAHTLEPARAGPALILRAPPTSASAEVRAFVEAPPPSTKQVSTEGLVLFPVTASRFSLPDFVWSPTSLIFKNLLGDAYDPEAVWQRPQVGWFGNLQAETETITVGLSLALIAWLRQWLRARGSTAQLTISPEQERLLAIGRALSPIPPAILARVDARRLASGAAVPDQFARNDAVLRRVGTSWSVELQAYVQAFGVWEGNASDANLDLAAAALETLIARIEPYTSVIGHLFVDRSLVDEPGYGMLFELQRDGRTRRWSRNTIASFINFATTQVPAFLARCREEGGSAERRSLLRGYVGFLGRSATAPRGDQVLSTGPTRVNAPPLPARMASSPRLDPPFFDAMVGTTPTFVMQVQFSDIYEHLSDAFGGWWYSWEALRVADADITRLAEPSGVEAVDTGMMARLGLDLGRDLRWADEDLRRVSGSIGRLDRVLGPPGIGASTLVGINAIMGMVGTLFRSGLRALTRPQQEFDVPLAQPGLYMIRCNVGPRIPDNPRFATYIRAPSVAWMPAYARSATQMNASRLRVDRAATESGEAREREVNRLLTSQLCLVDPEGLRRERDELRLSLHGTTLEQFQHQRALLIRQRDAISNPRAPNRVALQRSIDEIDRLIGMQRTRASMLGASSFRIPASFASDLGQVQALTIEVARSAAAQAHWYGDSPERWRVSDITTSRSGHAEGVARGRRSTNPFHDAVLDGLQKLLESQSGYGRGMLSVYLPDSPPRGNSVPGSASGRTVTIRIATDETGIALQGIENLTTLISIAAVVAAPFTGGASLTILVPVGIIGALPSAYRLIHRGAMGTLRFDLQTAMEVVDIVSAAAGLGELAAAGRATSAGVRSGLRWVMVERTLWITGIGLDGLGMMLMGAQLVEQIAALRDLPPGLRAARTMEIIGGALQQLGIQAGAHLASRARLHDTQQRVHSMAEESAHRRAAQTATPDPAATPAAPTPHPHGTDPASRATPTPTTPTTPTTAPPRRGTTRASQAMLDQLPPTLVRSTEILIDRRLPPGEVRVEYTAAGGLVDPNSIRIVASPHARAIDIRLHAMTVTMLRRYSGLQGRVRRGLARLGELLTGRQMQAGSPAWEARLELRKLDGIVRQRMQELRSLAPESLQARSIEADIAHLEGQIQRAEQILSGGVADPRARGFIAMEGRTTFDTNLTLATAAGYPANLPPGHHYRNYGNGHFDIVVAPGFRRRAWIEEHGGRRHLVTTELSAVDRANWRASLDGYGPPPPGHRWVEDGPGRWQSNLLPGATQSPVRVVHDAHGRPQRDANGWVTQASGARTFADRQASAGSGWPTPRHTALESGMTAAGVPNVAGERGIIRQWSEVVTRLDTEASTHLGDNLRTGAEVAQAATSRLRAGYGETEYGHFRRELRAAEVEAILAPDPSGAARRSPAEQRASLDSFIAAQPDNASSGALLTAYRQARQAAGGVPNVANESLPNGRLQPFTGSPPTKVADGAMQVTTPVSVPGRRQQISGRMLVDDKVGGSFDRPQCTAYSQHLGHNGGTMHTVDGGSWGGLVYFFADVATARQAVNWMNANNIHANVHVAYLGGPPPTRPASGGASASASTVGPGQIGWLR